MSADPRRHRFTIYDMMEAKGLFDNNPANPQARDPVEGTSTYAKQEYPKLFYHPKGEEKITVQPEIVVTPMGPKYVGEQRQLIDQLANSPAEEAKLRAEGWHDHPAKAMTAAGKKVPATGAAQQISGLEAQIAELQRQLELANVGNQASAAAAPLKAPSLVNKLSGNPASE